MTRLDGATVLITGATGGFGQQMTRQFAAAGSRLILSDVDQAGLDELQGDIGADAAQIVAGIAADLGDESGCLELFGAVQARGKMPDVLVNNAGIAYGGRFDHVPRDRWERVLQVNLLAPLRLTYLCLPAMIERGSGHIVNISSIAGWLATPGASSYAASKFGLRGYSESLAEDLGPVGIKVSAVYPFFSRTPILDSEHFGYETPPRIPEDLATDPADVVAAIIKGIRRDKLHIFPDGTARVLYYLRRFLPWTLPLITEHMRKRVFAKK